MSKRLVYKDKERWFSLVFAEILGDKEKKEEVIDDIGYKLLNILPFEYIIISEEGVGIIFSVSGMEVLKLAGEHIDTEGSKSLDMGLCGYWSFGEETERYRKVMYEKTGVFGYAVNFIQWDKEYQINLKRFERLLRKELDILGRDKNIIKMDRWG